MSKHVRFLAAALVLSLATGCYTTHVVTSAGSRGMPVEDTQVHFIYGLTSSRVSAVECPNGLASVSFELPWWHLFVAGFTFGLVDVGSTSYQCVDGSGTRSAEKTIEPVQASGTASPLAAR